MNKFEEQFKNLPWAQPPAHLRGRIFVDSSLGSGSWILRISRRAVGWAALWLLTGSIMGYGLGRIQSEPAPSVYPPGDVIVVETDTETQFFNQTDTIHEVIPGEWVLYIEPEGGIQG